MKNNYIQDIMSSKDSQIFLQSKRKSLMFDGLVMFDRLGLYMLKNYNLGRQLILKRPVFYVSDSFFYYCNLKSFQNSMNSQYFKNYINIKEQSKAAYESYLVRVKQYFQVFKSNPTNLNSLKLHTELSRLKDFKDIKQKDRPEIFKYCVEQNIEQFLFFRNSNNKWLSLLKITKTNVENYELDWKAIWNRLISSEPEVPTMKLYTQIKDFLISIRHLYDPNNAVEVLNYFISKHSLNTQNSYLVITYFSNICSKTSSETLLIYIRRLLQLYDTNQLKAGNLLVMFINACKHKYQEIPEEIYEQFNKIILYSLTTPMSEKKDSIQNKFNTETVNITTRIIGRCNKHSVYLLQKIFQLIKNFIRPFEDSKKPLKFLYRLIKGITKRIQRQKNAKVKLEKLKIKEEKRRNKLILKKKQQQKQKQSEQKPQEDLNKAQDNEESAMTKVEDNEQKKDVKKSQQEEESDDQNDDEDESQEEQGEKMEKLMGMQLQVEEKAGQKSTELHTKIENLQALLRNEITDEIKDIFKSFIDQIFQDVFYVNSKMIVHRMLLEIFKIYPEFIDRAFLSLEKASNIPQINEQGLISNISCMAKYLFTPQYRSSPTFLQNALKILNRVQQNRKISDVWSIINIFTQKIPLMDEKDYQLIKEEQKQQFQKTFLQNHDRFYESYSQIVFECLKRLFRQSEHFDQSTSNLIDKYLVQLFSNCHKHFKIRVLKKIEEQVCQNNNRFLISIFHSYIKPSKRFEVQLRELIQNINIDNEENLELDIMVNTILSVNMEIEDIKSLIRKYSKKNNYKFVRQCMINLTNYTFLINPLESSLAYFTTKPTITIIQEPSHSLICSKLQHVFEYSQELIESLLQQLKEFDEKPLENVQYQKIVLQLYQSKENNYKNMKVEKRKLINELLQILKIIMEYLVHELQEYNPLTNIIQYRKTSYNRISLLKNEKFTSIIDRILYNEIFLHDQNIMNNLALIIQNEVFFMYKNQLKIQKDVLNKYQKNNKKDELPGQTNLQSINNTYITKARIIHFSILYNQYKDCIDITAFEKQFKLLLIAPGSEKSSHINKIFINREKNLSNHAQLLISLLGLNIDSRFYYEKVFTLLREFNLSGYEYTPDQIIKIVDYHVPLIQSENMKIRQHSLKSFEKFLTALNKSEIIGKVQKQLRKYITKEKCQIIWIMFVIIILKDQIRAIPVEFYLENISQYLEELSKFITSDTRLLRRIALFAYSFCLRKAKKAIRTYQVRQCEPLYSKCKDIYQIFQDGYIRQEHKDLQDISNKSILKKLSPYSQYSVKKRNYYAIYEQIESRSFDFILKNLQVGEKILKQYHTDMAGSLEQAMAAMQGKKIDLGEITFKLLQGNYVYCKLKKLNFDKIEYYFGERFFRYLLNKDGKTGFNFFLKTKNFFQGMMVNFQSYDNQTIIFIYTLDLMLAYEKHFKETAQQVRVQIEQCLLKIIREIIYKGSGALFKKFLIIVEKIINIESIRFLITYLESLFKNKQKISRVTQLLTKIYGQNYKKYLEMISYALDNKIQLNQTYIINFIELIVALPQKYVLQESLIKKYNFIDAESQLLGKHVQKYKDSFYILNTHEFNSLFIKKLEQYVKEAEQINQQLENVQNRQKGQNGQKNEKQGLELLKQKNELIKIIFALTINATNAYIQFYQTQETIDTIIALLNLLFRLFQFKMELIIDFKVLQDIFKNIFSNKFQNIQYFEKILNLIVKNIPKLSIKKQAEIVHIIAHRPGNLLFIHKDAYKTFVKQIVALQDNFMIYKELLVNISTILAYIPLSESQINQIVSQIPKNQKILLMQCYVLSSINIVSMFVGRILKQSGKERRNIFCKQMLVMRGKRQYLDNEQKYSQWKQIKQYSNPYHYHA